MEMTIDEAIRILNLDIESGCSTPPANLDEAEGLGIEALKAIKPHLRNPQLGRNVLLPGETEE